MRRSKLVVVLLGMLLGLFLGHTLWAQEEKEEKNSRPFVLIIESVPTKQHKEDLLESIITTSKNMRGQDGLIRYKVLQGLDDKAAITVVSEWESMDTFAEWMHKGGINAGQTPEQAKMASIWTQDYRTLQSAVADAWEPDLKKK